MSNNPTGYDVPLSAREEALGFMRRALDTEYTKQLEAIDNERHALDRVVNAWPLRYEADEFFEVARQSLSNKRSQLRRAYNQAWTLLETLELLPKPATS